MQIQPNERDKIAVWLGQKLSAREIGRKLGRNPSVISREIKRNRFKENYVAIHAQNLANKRSFKTKQRCWWQDQKLYAYVIEKLKESWSPEQISGRLERENRRPIILRFLIPGIFFFQRDKVTSSTINSLAVSTIERP